MASKLERKIKSKAKKTIKKTHSGYIIVAVIALIAGLAIGYFGASFISGGDVLSLNGDKITVVNEGETVTYVDEGIKYVSNGKDLSGKYEISDTNMVKNSDGAYVGVPTADQELYIIYTVIEGRAAGQTLYRVFRVDTPASQGGDVQ